MSDDIRIVILQRGRVHVGFYERVGFYVRIVGGANVRRWGTTEGLGQLAEHGPLEATRLDPQKYTEAHVLAEVESIKCNADSWLPYLSSLDDDV